MAESKQLVYHIRLTAMVSLVTIPSQVSAAVTGVRTTDGYSGIWRM